MIVCWGCSSSGRVYQPPRLGAEYRFEDGLRREKRPQYLFSKKELKDMEKMGQPSGQRPGGKDNTTTAAVPKAGPVGPRVDSTRIGSTQAPARMDSVHTSSQKDSAQVPPHADSTMLP